MEDKTNSGTTVVETAENASATPTKKPAKSKSPAQREKAQREKSSHPPTSEMVNAAIKELKDRKGSSVQAIKKYIATTYKVDGEKFAPFIKRYLKSAVTSGAVVQTKGKGASGSFKLPTRKKSKVFKSAKVVRPAKKAASKKKQPVEKVVSKKSAPAKKPVSPKKSVAEKKAAAPKKSPAKAGKSKPKTVVEAKSMSKTKKTAKAPAVKTKTPKPKKVAAPRAVKSTQKK